MSDDYDEDIKEKKNRASGLLTLIGVLVGLYIAITWDPFLGIMIMSVIILFTWNEDSEKISI